MTAEQALAAVDQINERLRQLRRKLRDARTGPVSEVIPQLQQEIAQALVHKELLLDHIQRMEKAG